jgi:hypothetical protein
MEAAGLSETSACTYKTTWQDFLEGGNRKTGCCENHSFGPGM